MEEEELIYGDVSFEEEENNNVEDELLMNSPTANEIDTHNVYSDERRNQEEDTSIQLGTSEIKEEETTFVVKKENEKVQKAKEIEKERQKVINNESNKQRKLINPANFETLDQYDVPRHHEALVITNLAWWTTDKQLLDILLPFGKIVRLRFIEDKMNGKSTGECLVIYEHYKNAIAACNELSQSTVIDKKKLNFEVATARVFDKLKHQKRTDPKFINSHQHQQQQFNNHNNQNNQHSHNNQQNHKQSFQKQQQFNQQQQQQKQQQQQQQPQFQVPDQSSMQQQKQQQQRQQRFQNQVQDEPPMLQQRQQQRFPVQDDPPLLQQFQNQGQDEPPMQRQRFQYAPNDVRSTRGRGGGGGGGNGGGGGFQAHRVPSLEFNGQQPEFLPHVNPNQFNLRPHVQNQVMFSAPSFHGMPPMLPQANFVPHVNPAFLLGNMNDDRMRGREMDPRDFHRQGFNEPDRERKYPLMKQEPRRDIRDDDRDDGRERYERMREDQERDYYKRKDDERRERKDDDRPREKDSRKDKYRGEEDRNYRDKPRERMDKDRDREKERKRSRSDYDYESSDRKSKGSRKDDM